MQREFLTAERILRGSGISVVDAARLIRNILDMREMSNSPASNAAYCRKVIDTGCAAVSSSAKSKTLGAGNVEGYEIHRATSV